VTAPELSPKGGFGVPVPGAGQTRDTDSITQQAEGALAAQSAAERLRDEWTTPDLAWLAFIEVAAKHGWRSPACRAFVHELAKRAAAG